MMTGQSPVAKENKWNSTKWQHNSLISQCIQAPSNPLLQAHKQCIRSLNTNNEQQQLNKEQ